MHCYHYSFQVTTQAPHNQYHVFLVLWLNIFPIKNGISESILSKEIMDRTDLDCKKHCKLVVGKYCEIYDKPDPSNTTIPRTPEAIALDPKGNLNGTYKFVCTKTWRMLKRCKFNDYPMPQQVINTVKKLGGKSNKTEYGEIYILGTELKKKLLGH